MRIEYAIGVQFDEADADTKAQYEQLLVLPDSDPLKHELFAGLLQLAVRIEHRDADYWRGEQRRQAALAARRAARQARAASRGP